MPPPTPYRLVSSREAAIDRDVDEDTRLGVHRLTCAPSLVRGLAPAFMLVAMLLLFGCLCVMTLGPLVFAFVLPCGLLGFAFLAWAPIRSRDLRVELHVGGVAVSRGKKREIVLFDDVDEVWMTIDPLRTPLGTFALISALRLVLHDGSTRRVPTNLKHAEQIVRAVVLSCSYPLQAQAAKSVRDGETLTFGPIELDRTGLRSRSWAARWEDLSLVRHGAGRLSLFRRRRFVPWRTIRLDRVPHPTVFMKLVVQCAPKVEADAWFDARTG